MHSTRDALIAAAALFAVSLVALVAFGVGEAGAGPGNGGDERKPGSQREERAAPATAGYPIWWPSSMHCYDNGSGDATRDDIGGYLSVRVGPCDGGNVGACAWHACASGEECEWFGICTTDTPRNDAWCRGMNQTFPEVCPPPAGDPEEPPHGGGGSWTPEDDANPPCPPGGCKGGNLRSAPPSTGWSAPPPRPTRSRWSQPVRRNGWWR